MIVVSFEIGEVWFRKFYLYSIYLDVFLFLRICFLFLIVFDFVFMLRIVVYCLVRFKCFDMKNELFVVF